jgi:hypothetical protein
MIASSAVSFMSANPPGRSNLPFAGSNARVVSRISPFEFVIIAAVDADALA